MRHAGLKDYVTTCEFQSTHPQGVRLVGLLRAQAEKVFQSTHPQWVRRQAPLVFLVIGSFNPRTRRGCDLDLLLLSNAKKRSEARRVGEE